MTARSLAIWSIFLLFLWNGADARGDTHSPATRVRASDLTIDELMDIEIGRVYGASKFRQKVTEAPSSVSIVTSEEISRYGYRTLADILSAQRSFTTSYDRNYAFVGIRGFARPGDYNTRVLLLIDGHKINNNVYDSAPIGTEFPLDVDLIDRIEVIRGPSSSLYGNSAFFGVINVITRRADQIKGGEYSAEAASHDTYKGRLTYGHTFKGGAALVMSGSYFDSRGQSLYFKEFDAPETNHGWADKADGDRFGSLFADLRVRDFTFQSAYITREKVVPTASFETVFNTDRTRTTDVQGYLTAKYEKDLDTLTNIMARVHVDYYGYWGDYLVDQPPLVLNRDATEGKWWGAEVKAVKTLFGRHKATAGVEYQDDILQEQRNFDDSPRIDYLRDRRNSYSWAAYIQDEVPLMDDLILNIGVRHDQYKTFGGTTNPRVALIYNHLDQTTIKVLYGQAFRAPNAYELYYDDGGSTTLANPDLEPETIRTIETVLEQYLGGYRLTAAAFMHRIKNLITLEGNPPATLLRFRNTRSVESKGLEFEVQKAWDNGIDGRLSYTVQQTEDRETGKSLTNSPKHLLKLNLFVPIVGERLGAGIEAQYTGPRRSDSGPDAGGFGVMNLTLLSRGLPGNIAVSGSVYNLFDKKYGDPASAELTQVSVPQDGRTFRIKVTGSF